jgi:hypothetical protein
MATLTAEQFRKMFPQANNEPVTRVLGRGLQAIADPLNQYRLPESTPLIGGISAADFTGLTGAQGVLQDFSKGNLQSGDMRMFDLLGLGAGAVPVAKTALKGGGLLGKEALRQMNEGTGLLGKATIDSRINIVPVDVAKQFNMKTTLPKSDEFASAVQGTKGAEITPEGLQLSLQRFQKPEQELSESVRTGVFYLPEGSANIKYYKNKGTLKSGNPYGGEELITGKTVYKNPLFVKGATGGKAPEEAYKKLLGKDKFDEFQKYVRSAASAPYKMREEVAYDFLQRYAPEISDNAWNIVQNSTQGNQLRYALQEAVIANEARKAGYDSILGYSKGKDGLRISEVFDLREQLYPSPMGEYGLMPEFEGLLRK